MRTRCGYRQGSADGVGATRQLTPLVVPSALPPTVGSAAVAEDYLAIGSAAYWSNVQKAVTLLTPWTDRDGRVDEQRDDVTIEALAEARVDPFPQSNGLLAMATKLLDELSQCTGQAMPELLQIFAAQAAASRERATDENE